MIVVCTTLLNPEYGDVITVGRKYMVLEVYCNKCEKEELDIKYTIIGDNSPTPLSLSATEFEIIDNRMPRSWRIKYTGNKLMMAPVRWIDESLWQYSFWEDYWGDDDAKAKQVFAEEVAIMEAESKSQS